MKIITIITLSLTLILAGSCNKVSNTPRGCVTAFIVSIEQHDMSRTWGLMGKDAQAFYNDLGEKQRRSGKGALENEINRIKTFKSLGKDYVIRKDKDNENNVRLLVPGIPDFIIQTVDEDNSSKIKDAQSVKNVLAVISADVEKNTPY